MDVYMLGDRHERVEIERVQLREGIGPELEPWTCPDSVDGWVMRYSSSPYPRGEESFPRGAGE